MLRFLNKGGDLFLKLAAATLACVCLIYSLFTLWDMFSTELKAFASYDLLKYRPNIEEDEPPYLDELVKINPDTAAWVTIYGTNIDYPVMQGKTDMEYLNKTALGGYSQSGSIFLSQLNKKDFSDPYNLIYGHHMENGSMFGDIDKFKDRNFFMNKDKCRVKHEEGVLIMENKVYNLKVMAFMDTNAYDNNIYRADKTPGEIPGFLAYAKQNAKLWRDVGPTDKLLVLSTCHDGSTDGRSVLVCQMKTRTTPLPTREAEPLTTHRNALGHPMAGAYWALLNLFIMLITLYTALPVHVLLKNRKEAKMEESDAEAESGSGTPKKRVTIERALLFLCAADSFILFYLTEDFHKPIQVVDIWTPIMLFLLIATLLIRWCSIRDLKSILARRKTWLN